MVEALNKQQSIKMENNGKMLDHFLGSSNFSLSKRDTSVHIYDNEEEKMDLEYDMDQDLNDDPDFLKGQQETSIVDFFDITNASFEEFS